MTSRRVKRVQELLREVISEVIFFELKNPNLPTLLSITRVEVTEDIQLGKVYVSIQGTEEEKKHALSTLNSAKGFISRTAAKKVVLRFFPKISFHMDDALDHQIHMEHLINQIQEERKLRDGQSERGSSSS